MFDVIVVILFSSYIVVILLNFKVSKLFESLPQLITTKLERAHTKKKRKKSSSQVIASFNWQIRNIECLSPLFIIVWGTRFEMKITFFLVGSVLSSLYGHMCNIHWRESMWTSILPLERLPFLTSWLHSQNSSVSERSSRMGYFVCMSRALKCRSLYKCQLGRI